MPVTILAVLPACSVVAHTDDPQHEWEIPMRKDSGDEVQMGHSIGLNEENKFFWVSLL